MYNTIRGIPEFGRSIVVKHGCPIELSMPDDTPPLFTVGSTSNSFEFCFEHDALREFVTLGEEALTTMKASQSRAKADAAYDPGRAQLGTEGASVDTMRHQSWVWISRGCPMEYIVSSGDSMFFRIGPPSNRFEPTFDVEALRSFVQLAREALAMIDNRDDRERAHGARGQTGELVFAGAAPEQVAPTGQH